MVENLNSELKVTYTYKKKQEGGKPPLVERHQLPLTKSQWFVSKSTMVVQTIINISNRFETSKGG